MQKKLMHILKDYTSKLGIIDREMKEIKTKDGSLTLHNEEYDETYHSTTGAKEETFEKFIKPCKIKELAKKGNIRILDICFGLGYNAIAAIETR